METNKFHAVPFMRAQRDALSAKLANDPDNMLQRLKLLEEKYRRLLEMKSKSQ